MALDHKHKIIDLLLNPNYRWLWHILFWLLMYLDTFLSFIGITPGFESNLEQISYILLDMVFVYFNLYVLVPYLLFRNKIIIYILATAFCVLCLVYLQHNIFPEEIEEEFLLSMYLENFFFNLIIMSVAASIKVLKSGFQTKIDVETIRSQQLESELSFLKNQVNPHFLFNTLNNLYIQSKKKEDISDSLMSFSDLLRYQIYETKNDLVALQKEVDYLENYLQLEKKRRSNLDIQIKTKISNPHIKIAPLLFLPLVENAVKYSQKSNSASSYITLSIEEENGQLLFIVKNSKGRISEIKTPDSGIGIPNVKKRLNLIYPDKYDLSIQDQQDDYQATLKINLR